MGDWDGGLDPIGVTRELFLECTGVTCGLARPFRTPPLKGDNWLAAKGLKSGCSALGANVDKSPLLLLGTELLADAYSSVSLESAIDARARGRSVKWGTPLAIIAGEAGQ